MTKAIGALLVAAGPAVLFVASLGLIAAWQGIAIAVLCIILGFAIVIAES